MAFTVDAANIIAGMALLLSGYDLKVQQTPTIPN
ncbi:hypothetical protein ACNJC6_03237 [Acinetobacter johnsonii]|uniref:Uncharacterized protein n=1 Tax=Acinetobacter johnsonii TaxID=40214 RepID=A0A1R7QHB5_ACIJO|nr:hypothetical protein ACNJC6_03237 [Acinetobacter johnsonii]